MVNLAIPIEKLPRVGPKNVSRFKRLGIKTVRDLLWHFPARYEDYSRVIPISEINGAGEMVSIQGTISDIQSSRSWRRKLFVTTATIEDESGIINAVWFNQPYIERSLPAGTAVSLSGKVSLDKKGLYLSGPSYEKINDSGASLTHTGRLVPIYPETEGISSKYLRFLIKPILAKAGNLPDPLPQAVLDKYNFPKLTDALNRIHFPQSIEEAEPARQRFAFEEILLFQLRVLRDRRQLRALKAPKIIFNKELIARFVKELPFELTNDQRVAAYEILQDLARDYPMNRLLNGDVGSGKTVVALIAAYQAAAAGYQAALMVPTEILAKQHFETIASLLDKKGFVRIGLLTGSEARQWPIDETEQKKISKKLMAQKIAEGKINLIIGTHAIIQKSVQFKNLGFVIIDEQHRFGVEQRMKLVRDSSLQTTNYKLQTSLIPHLLSMTATPIPRTLALTIYGDLDVSLLKEKPKGRQPIITKIIPHAKREAAHRFIEQEIRNGRQVFVICPRIAAPECGGEPRPKGAGNIFPEKPISQTKLIWAEVKAVAEEYRKLSEKIFPNRKVAMLHGKLKPKEKDGIMRDFKNKHYDLLVSTSVVEVGVDIPNATIMMIESAERFGLAQLHQFRGRVGRGGEQSYCLLFTSSDDVPAGRRLRALEKLNDGFELAEIDLKIRGPGEFTGLNQSGVPDFAMASLTDLDLIKKARLEAKLILKSDPALRDHPLLLERLCEMQRLVHFE